LEMGPTDPGIAKFASSVTCSAGAVSQVVEMPAYEDAEPFVAEVIFRISRVEGVDVGYNRAFRRLRATKAFPEWNTDSFCLGQAGYGGPVKFQIAATERTPECFISPEGTIEVDHFNIKVAAEGECPGPGESLNGEADLNESEEEWGWEFDRETAGAGAVEASLQPGVGESGTSGARIFRPAGSENLAAMHAPLSVPLASSLSSPALRFWWRGGTDWWYRAGLGTYSGMRAVVRPLDSLRGDGEARVATYCLPPWTHGNVVDLSFLIQGGPPEKAAELVVDSVEIVSDDRCGAGTDILDPGFDSGPYRWPGVSIRYEDQPGSDVRVINDPARAHPPGAGVLEIRYASNQTRLDVHTWVWVPPSEGNRGPQLSLHSSVPSEPNGLPVFWVLGATRTAGELECFEELCPNIPLKEELLIGGGWQRRAPCLPLEWANRWYRFRISIRPSNDPLEVYDTPRTVLLDDFEVTLDEACGPP
jgi:hypothetical protein